MASKRQSESRNPAESGEPSSKKAKPADGEAIPDASKNFPFWADYLKRTRFLNLLPGALNNALNGLAEAIGRRSSTAGDDTPETELKKNVKATFGKLYQAIGV